MYLFSGQIIAGSGTRKSHHGFYQEHPGVPAAQCLRAKHIPPCVAAIRRRLSSLTITM